MGYEKRVYEHSQKAPSTRSTQHTHTNSVLRKCCDSERSTMHSRTLLRDQSEIDPRRFDGLKKLDDVACALCLVTDRAKTRRDLGGSGDFGRRRDPMSTRVWYNAAVRIGVSGRVTALAPLGVELKALGNVNNRLVAAVAKVLGIVLSNHRTYGVKLGGDELECDLSFKNHRDHRLLGLL